ncbi:MAG: NfeD family protein [Thermogutta sp.]
MDTWIWPVLLLLAGLFFAALELFFVSYGVLTFLAVASASASIVLGFWYSQSLGMSLLLVTVLGIPAFLTLFIRVWPRIGVGKKIMLQERDAAETLPDNPILHRLKELVGRIGEVKSPMLPAGVVQINGRSYDALSEGTAIDVGRKVKVVSVQGTWLVVQAVDEIASAGEEGDLWTRPLPGSDIDPFRQG